MDDNMLSCIHPCPLYQEMFFKCCVYGCVRTQPASQSTSQSVNQLVSQPASQSASIRGLARGRPRKIWIGIFSVFCTYLLCDVHPVHNFSEIFSFLGRPYNKLGRPVPTLPVATPLASIITLEHLRHTLSWLQGILLVTCCFFCIVTHSLSIHTGQSQPAPQTERQTG